MDQKGIYILVLFFFSGIQACTTYIQQFQRCTFDFCEQDYDCASSAMVELLCANANCKNITNLKLFVNCITEQFKTNCNSKVNNTSEVIEYCLDDFDSRDICPPKKGGDYALQVYDEDNNDTDDTSTTSMILQFLNTNIEIVIFVLC